ncbi:MAG: cobyrinate a,c-diamide synthase [Clostridia bacterium]|nr:cobyrinate a,c-diamide synthase [Clostridia bacterium]
MTQPRVLIAGTSSSSGKTTAVCALLSLLKRRRISVRSFKCGPDYIDPMFHRSVIGIKCSNLDPFFCDDDLLRYLLFENAAGNLAVIEGVMGYYDGTGDNGSDNSTYSVAKKTDSPVIIVVNAKGASSSLLAVVEGFLNYLPNSNIRGVLFNRMSLMNYKYVCSLMKIRFRDSVIPVGYIPELPDECLFPSRHLGLVTAAEITDLQKKLDKIADICENTIDIDAVLSIADKAGRLNCTSPAVPAHEKINIAAAFDSAFCFYYSDNFDLLKKMGAEITFFSPLKNEPVPRNADGLLLGGGYPELYTDILEKNEISKNSILNSIESGMPAIAECGGFQYLGKTVDGKKMCGLFDSESFSENKLVRFGYNTITSEKDGIFGKKGTSFKAHEFHYWDSTLNGDSFTAVKPNGKSWKCAFTTDTLYAGYPHLYLWSNLPAANNFYNKCLEYKERKNDHQRP